MLVLTRMPDETVVIEVPGEEPIYVTVVRVSGDKVRLGFDADKKVAIHRKEVYKAIQKEKARNKEQNS